MKNSIVLILFVLIFASCKNNTSSAQEPNTDEQTKAIAYNYKSFGKEIKADKAIDAKAISKQFNSMKPGDTIITKVKAKVNAVCQAKGCWMKLDLENGKEAMVKFKDYGFFMPKDISGKEVIINGKAFVNEMPVDELRHYAEDAGKTKEEIEAITKPKKTYSFEADGVLLIEEAN